MPNHRLSISPEPQKLSAINIPRFSPLLVLTTLLYFLLPLNLCYAEAGTDIAYRAFPFGIPSRVAIWIVAQLHLYFAAFVLAVPMFALIIEFIGYKTKDKKYDHLAHEFTKLLSVSFSLTATLGALLTFMLMVLYPKFTNYLVSVFHPTFFIYGGLFFFEAFFLYSYYYGWGKFSPRMHLLLGLGLNLVGTTIMVIANGWATFMTSPRGINESTGELTSVANAVMNDTWMPINIHRFIANIAFGGAIASAYGAYKFLGATTDDERAHYDWMGYIGNFIAISAFLPLPFAGYWLGKEIYGYSQNLGMTLMGGAFSWLFIIQAILIGVLFLSANFYLWLGMGRIPGALRYKRFIKYILIVVVSCFAVWATPSSIIANAEEMGVMGGSQHPILKFLGVMSAKNTAVNILILSTYVSFLLYRRGNKEPSVAGAKSSSALQLIIISLSILFVGWMSKYSWKLPVFGFANPKDIPTSAQIFSWVGASTFFCLSVLILYHYVSYRRNKLEAVGQLVVAAAALLGIWRVALLLMTYSEVAIFWISPWLSFFWRSFWPGILVYLLVSGGILYGLFAILFRLLSFWGDRRESFPSWATVGNGIQFLVFVAAICFVIFIGIYGYIVPTAIRIKMSVPQVLSVLTTMILVTWIDVLMLRNAKIIGDIEWGKMPIISQYTLFLTAITFTWLMGLMGYVRSGLRQHWHVYGVMKDASPDAFTPTLGFASSIVSITVIIFFSLIAFIFWLASLGNKKDYEHGQEQSAHDMKNAGFPVGESSS